MSQLLQAMYDQFYSFKEDLEMIREIDSSHRALSAELSKEQRRIPAPLPKPFKTNTFIKSVQTSR